jgi:hypothetical protein
MHVSSFHEIKSRGELGLQRCITDKVVKGTLTLSLSVAILLQQVFRRIRNSFFGISDQEFFDRVGYQVGSSMCRNV